MILRKPYAFFIKRFRLIHFILSFLMIYCVYNTNKLLAFFNEYIVENINLKGQELVSIYTPNIYQILPFLILIILALLLGIMILKKKPMVLYIMNIASFVYTEIAIQIAKGSLGTMESSILDPRSTRLTRDIIMISYIIQIICTIAVLIRSVGFDVKKFDFKSDLKELEISEADREEIEVEFNFDKNKAKRNVRRKIRFLKYAYKENKKLVHISIVVFILALTSLGGYSYIKMERPVFENTYITANATTLKINKSYITQTDYKGNVIDKDSLFVILQIDIKSNNPSVQELSTATTELSVGEYTYVPTYDYIDSFYDFGTVYVGNKISTEYEKKVLVYKIPIQLKDEEINFNFLNKLTSEKTTVKLNLIDLTKRKNDSNVEITQTLDFKNSILSGYKMSIDEYEIQDKYKLEYNFCYQKECIKSSEYLVPSINTNTDKTILKIKGNITINEKIPKINNIYNIINSFGTIHYKIDGKEKTNQIELKQIVSTKIKEENTFYIEVPKELKNAESIFIRFNVRNVIYEYKLK